MTEIVRLSRGDDTEALVAPIVLAFASDPFVRWLLPDPSRYVEVFTAITRIHVNRTGPTGGAFRTSDGRAAATWYPPGVHTDGPAMGAVLAGAGATERVAKVWPLVEQHEPPEPHWYLRQIGVDPRLQGHGLGGALLEAGLAVVDAEQATAYLEATTEDSRRLYERHGFVVLAEVRAEGAPPLWPMRREPVGR